MSSVRVSPTNNKVSTFSIFLGESILAKICLEHFQKVDVSTLPRSDWGFGGQNKTEFEVCLSFWDLVHGEWPIPTKFHLAKWTCPLYFGDVRLNSPQINEQTTQFSVQIVSE